MKYCLQYSNKCKYLSQADEITIKYIEDRGLVNFLENHSSQRVNLLVEGNLPQTEIRKLLAIKIDYPDYRFAVAFKHTIPEEVINTFAAAGIPFYSAAPCFSWELLNRYIKLGVSDINISGPLAFELPKVKRLLELQSANIQIRMTPNYCQTVEAHTDHLIGFFVRPEDVEIYADYVDILDFHGVENQDIFYRIYAVKKRFLGNLNTCIYNLQLDLDNRTMVKLFGERRVACGQECLKGGRCRRCYDLAHLAAAYRDQANQKINQTIENAKESLGK